MTIRTRPARSAAFTLIELLVAVGAVALVAVAIAAVFEATGRTVSTGRRVGALNAYAALLKQQLERDFATMTRDGFLIIRNEMADVNGDGAWGPADLVPLHPDDLNPRVRRIDEIMFFAKGEFTTAREPLEPALVARSDAAAVYYGHGQRRIPDNDPNGLYRLPRLDDRNDSDSRARLAFRDPVNPNRFASDWILVRHLTLLSPRQATTRPRPFPATFALAPAELSDYDNQVALQPAASNVFRSLSNIFPVSFGSPIRAVRPLRSSGLVDIATTDLSEIRLVVITSDVMPGQAQGNFFDPLANSNPVPQPNAGVDGIFRQFGTGPGQDAGVLGRMQAWMSDALPAWSGAPNPAQRARIRCEPAPPNYVGVLAAVTQPPVVQAYSRADQLMLSGSNFIPRCTEFIVEWSFGKTYPSDPSNPDYVVGREGELIWHGLERLPDGTPVQNDSRAVVRPYDEFQRLARLEKPYQALDGSIRLDPSDLWVRTDLVHGQGYSSSQVAPGAALTSYFGYVDPYFKPDKDNDGLLESPVDAASPTYPWAWPRLVRVTIGLADPADSAFEQRFQFVLPLPREPGR